MLTRRVGWSGALAALALAAAACGGEDEDRGAAVAEVAPTPVEISVAAIETVEETLRISGDVMPWQVQPLSFKVAGKIARLYVDEGDAVKRNQLVAVLDTVDYRLVRDLAATQVAGLKPNLDRAEKLFEKEAVSAAQMDELTSRLEAAEIQRAQAEAQLSYSWLRAPSDGVVVKRLMSEGDLTDPAHPVAAIAELARVKVILPVAQADLPLFRVGDEVEIVEPGTRRAYRGRIFTIGYAADEKTRTFPLTLEVANPDLALRAGMIVDARVVVAPRTGIAVPLDALHRDIDGHPCVYVAAGLPPRAMERRVELGDVVGERVLVTSGLAAGDAVIVRGMVQHGERVAPVAGPAAVPPAAATDAGAGR